MGTRLRDHFRFDRWLRATAAHFFTAHDAQPIVAETRAEFHRRTMSNMTTTTTLNTNAFQPPLFPAWAALNFHATIHAPPLAAVAHGVAPDATCSAAGGHCCLRAAVVVSMLPWVRQWLTAANNWCGTSEADRHPRLSYQAVDTNSVTQVTASVAREEHVDSAIALRDFASSSRATRAPQRDYVVAFGGALRHGC